MSDRLCISGHRTTVGRIVRPVAVLAFALGLGGVVRAAPVTPAAHQCQILAPDADFVAKVMTDPASDTAASRVALVIGNGAYSGQIGTLPNPVNDATGVASMLHRLGFTVFLMTDGTAAEISSCADKLVSAGGGNAVSMLYYSGHGIQIDDRNFLVAVDATTDTKRLEGFVEIQPLVDALKKNAAATLVFLDACRNNPLVGNEGGEGLSVQTGRGLSRVTAELVAPGSGSRQARGLLVAYSTSPNAVASDGAGPYSPFTQAFLQHIGTPGFSIQRVLSEVANSVGEATNWSQTPWTRSSLTSALRLNGRQTLDEVVSTSENWAGRSKSALDKGEREQAIVAALKGLPAGFQDSDVDTFAAAHLALYEAVHAAHVRLSIDEPGYFWRWTVVSPDRSRVVFVHDATGGNDPRPVELWNAETGKKMKTLVNIPSLEFHTAPVFSPDGRILIVGGKDGQVLIFNAADGAQVAALPAFKPTASPFSVDSIAFSPDGSKLALTAHSFQHPAELRVWDFAQARFVETVGGKLFDSVAGSRVVGNDVLRAGFVDDGRLCVGVFRDRADDRDLHSPRRASRSGAATIQLDRPHQQGRSQFLAANGLQPGWQKGRGRLWPIGPQTSSRWRCGRVGRRLSPPKICNSTEIA